MAILDLFRKRVPENLANVGGSRGWFPLIREPYAGAWQKNDSITTETSLAFSAVYACVTLLAADVSKLRLKLVRRADGDRWTEVHEGSPFLPVLRKPNRYQTRNQFIESWMVSKLTTGNAYVLKDRDARGVVTRLYVLNPDSVTPLVADDGAVYYRLKGDNLAHIADELVVPARDMIHDRMNCLFHPLVGISPLFACGHSALMGQNITRNSAEFFANRAEPGGILTAPGTISQETADRLKEGWDAYRGGGGKMGSIAVLGDGLKFEGFAMKAVDAQLIEQLQWSAVDVARSFHVPAHMIGAGPVPNYATVEQLTSAYYSQTLQAILEAMEAALDDGLELPLGTGVEFDTTQLMRMDTATRWKAYGEAIGGGWMAPNEAREREDLPPTEGGDQCFLQQQNFSLQALARRDAEGDPFGTGKALPSAGAVSIKELREEGTLQTKGYRPRLRWHADVGDWLEVA